MDRMRNSFLKRSFAGMLIGAIAASIGGVVSASPDADDSTVIRLPARELPFSEFVSPEARAAWIEYQRKRGVALEERRLKGLPLPDLKTRTGILEERALSDEYSRSAAEEMRTRFPVVIERTKIGGVNVDVVRPADRPERKPRRILINLHGGGMVLGARWEGLVASIPIASLGGVEVVTVDYRMGPENKFPAANEDVEAVYRALLASHKSSEIGMYGCSAGGGLTASSIAWFQRKGLPLPGAIALDSGGAIAAAKGDSMYLTSAGSREKMPARGWHASHYFGDTDIADPIQSPAYHQSVMERFPPTLLISSTRDQGLSGILVTHRQLTKAKIEADLHVWEGMYHCFTYNDRLPESREAFDVMLKFFDKHLAK